MSFEEKGVGAACSQLTLAQERAETSTKVCSRDLLLTGGSMQHQASRHAPIGSLTLVVADGPDGPCSSTYTQKIFFS